MNKERFLTVRWNNLLALGVGLPVLAFAIVALATSAIPMRTGFIAFTVLGGVY